MGGDVTQKALKNFNPLFSLNYSATPVSYTHLDVYKRQELGRAVLFRQES